MALNSQDGGWGEGGSGPSFMHVGSVGVSNKHYNCTCSVTQLKESNKKINFKKNPQQIYVHQKKKTPIRKLTEVLKTRADTALTHGLTESYLS